MGVVDEQMRAYYEARAREYDDWWLGEGLFAERDRPGWRAEVARLLDVLAALAPARTGFLAEARRVGREMLITDSPLRDGVQAEEWRDRSLENGTAHRVCKRYFTGAGLVAELGSGEVLMDGGWFVVVRAR